MIELLVAMAGTDENGESFSAAPGDIVSLDKRSEESLIKNEMAISAKQRTSAKKSVKSGDTN